jgi:hypothetical protein
LPPEGDLEANFSKLTKRLVSTGVSKNALIDFLEFTASETFITLKWCPEPDLNRHEVAFEGF